MRYQIRKAVMEDYAEIGRIYAVARKFMEKNGNPTQWGNHYPPEELVRKDIREEKLHLVEDEIGIHGVFYFSIEDDPTYQNIENGQWRSNETYGVLHRVAGDSSGGILRTAVSYAESKIRHIRIDTHQDNSVMQNALSRLGFQKCGIVYMEDGSPRMAYDKIIR